MLRPEEYHRHYQIMMIYEAEIIEDASFPLNMVLNLAISILFVHG